MYSRRSLLSTIFISPSEPRLRAGWRLLIQVLMQIALSLGLGVALLIPYVLISGSPDLHSGPLLALEEALELVTILVSVYIARRFLDKRSFTTLGLQMDRRSWRDLLVGLGISGILMAAIFSTEFAARWLTVETFAWESASLPKVVLGAGFFLLVFTVGGWNEELLSRGYHLQTISSGTNLVLGLILSSAIFAALHFANPHANWASAIGILAAGVFLGLAYIWTRRLWLPIGLHLGWNFFEGVVFGFPVSGLQTFRLLQTSVSGPELWTGGAFGPEAGLIVVPALLLATALVYLYTRLGAKPC